MITAFTAWCVIMSALVAVIHWVYFGGLKRLWVVLQLVAPRRKVNVWHNDTPVRFPKLWLLLYVPWRRFEVQDER